MLQTNRKPKPNRMSILSKSLRVCFEVVNELYTAVGAGVLGIVVLMHHGFSTSQPVKSLSVIALTTASIVFAFSRQKEKIAPNKRKVVLITGCDSGLGYSMCQHAAECGFTVIAGFLSLESKGSKEIRKLYGGYIIQIHLDITDGNSVTAAVHTLEHYLSRNPGYTLHALVNNAAVMIFGEFEWQTERQMELQLRINLLGTFRCTKAFAALLRQHKGRLVIVSSHCSIANLPGLSVYGATKAALASWSDGLRVEWAKYGVEVVNIIPGSFVTQSNIMAKQLDYAQEMHDSFTPEQHHFYDDYFKRYNVYLSFITPPPVPMKVEDENLYKVLENALTDKYPDTIYKNENWRYRIYHFLFRLAPTPLRDYFVKKFMAMPEYDPNSPNFEDEDLMEDVEDEL